MVFVVYAVNTGDCDSPETSSNLVEYPMPYKDPDKQREYTRKWIAERRRVWLENNGPCVKCGSDENLQVDHVDPKLKISHKVWSWSEKRRNTELAKCQILCSNCHKKKTKSERPESAHGTARRYVKYRCRCEICRTWKRKDRQKYGY
jgi:hypothetical protein